MARDTELNRRHFLKGLGAATGIASSLFGSSVALGQTDEAPLRLLFMAITHGWGRNKEHGVISGSEFDFTLPSPLDRLNPIKQHCVFVDGVRGTLWGNAHDVSYSDIFTASVPWDETESDQLGRHFPEPMGPSVDWTIGNQLNKSVLRVSAGYGSWGKQHNPMCFDDRAREQAFLIRSRDAFDALVDPLQASAPSEESRIARSVDTGLLNYLGRDTERLLAKVSGTERLKVEDYLSALDSVGQRINMTGSFGVDPSEIPERFELDNGVEQEIGNYFELIRLAFKADTHRVGVFGIGNRLREWDWTDSMGSTRNGNIFGSDFHQDVAHYNNKPLNARLAYEGWVAWHIDQVVGFAQQMAETPDVDGNSLLDNTIIMLTGEVGTGTHDRRDKLHVLIGGGAHIRTGRWIDTPKVEARSRDGVFIGGERRNGEVVESGLNYGGPFSYHHTGDLLTSLARLAGANVDRIGFAVNNPGMIALT
ncbi:MAG: DUF1552 domain-containing protein [Myxococcota bacterium]